MIKRILLLTLLLLGVIMIGSLRGDGCDSQRASGNGKLFFYRIVIKGADHGKGDWHLFNEADRKYLREQSKIEEVDIQWADVEGRLPE